MVDSENKNKSVSLPAGQFEKLSEAAQQVLNTEWLTKKAEQTSAAFPEKPVKKGDKWQTSSEINAGAGSKLTFPIQHQYHQYQGMIERGGKTLDEIGTKVIDVSFLIDGNATTQLKSSELKVVDSAGTLLFDHDRGALVVFPFAGAPVAVGMNRHR